MSDSVTRTLVNFYTDIKFEDLPSDVVWYAKRLIFDTIGCALGGYRLGMTKKVLKIIKELGGKPESTIWATGDKVSCVNAAYTNAEMSYAMDADEIYVHVAHIAGSLVAPIIALGERIGASGRDIVTAFVTGFDLAGRCARAFKRKQISYENGEKKIEYPPVSSTANFVTLGIALACGKLLGLDKDRMADALGIAGYSAPVPCLRKWSECIPVPMTKYDLYGNIAGTGLMAALLASEGFSGDRTILDGDIGFWRMSGAIKCEWEVLTKKLGEKWAIMDTAIKPYPCCRFTHEILDGLYKILREKQLQPSEIDSITATIASHGHWLVKYHANAPVTEMSAQFHIPYLIAVAAMGKIPFTDWLSQKTLSSAEVQEFMKKVRIQFDPDTSDYINEQMEKEGYFRKCPATVIVKARGNEYRTYVELAKGDPASVETRITDEELMDKFRALSYDILPETRIESLTKMFLELDKLSDIKSLTDFMGI